jgi:5-methylcytosine-specific restriction enzyme A
MRQCLTDGCRELIAYGSRCKRHGGSNWSKYAYEHPERAAVYRNPRWKGLRDAQLASQPNCEVRLPGCHGRASEADHVTPLALGGAFDGPLRSVCRPCHLKLTSEASKESKRRAAAQNRWLG